MSYLIVRYAIYYGKYLQQRFGIQKFASPDNGERGASGESALRMINRIAKIEQKANMPKTPEMIELIKYEQREKEIQEEQHKCNFILEEKSSLSFCLRLKTSTRVP